MDSSALSVERHDRTKHVQQRASKRHAGHKCQAMITNAQGTYLLLPLLQCASLTDRWQLGTCFVEVQVLSVGADLLFWQ